MNEAKSIYSILEKINENSDKFEKLCLSIMKILDQMDSIEDLINEGSDE